MEVSHLDLFFFFRRKPLRVLDFHIASTASMKRVEATFGAFRSQRRAFSNFPTVQGSEGDSVLAAADVAERGDQGRQELSTAVGQRQPMPLVSGLHDLLQERGRGRGETVGIRAGERKSDAVHHRPVHWTAGECTLQA